AAWLDDRSATTAAIVLVAAAAGAAACSRLRQWILTVVLALLSGACWLALVGIGADRVHLAGPGFTWDGTAPLLLAIAAAALAAVPWTALGAADLPALPLRAIAAGVALWLTGYAVVAPFSAPPTIVLGVIALGALGSAGVASSIGCPPERLHGLTLRYWTASALAVLTLSALVWSATVCGQIVRAVDEARDHPLTGVGARWHAHDLTSHGGAAIPLLALVAALASIVTWGLVEQARQPVARWTLTGVGAVAVALSVAALAPYLWLVALMLAVLAATAVGLWAAPTAAGPLRLAAGVALAPLAATATWVTLTVVLVRLDAITLAATGVVVLGAALAVLGRTPASQAERWCLRGATAATALLTIAYGTPDAGWLAADLTVLAAGCAVLAVLDRDRWIAGASALIGLIALWVRLADSDVDVPEAYTVPAAAVVLAFGGWALWRQQGSRTLPTLGPGLAIGIVPSAVVALSDDGTGPRGLLLLIGGIVLVGLGLVLRWLAPLLLGAVTTVGATVRYLAPFLDDVPPTLLLVSVGAVLLAGGIRWESLAVRGRTAWAHLVALR
ncbi:MAG: hypothetical protein QM572_15145, partial [Nocardioides sp.]|uniref:SCO7613 C-terminal domain-containing membrane protein n=1 Tax=Nocardioides sp. TaxID=35761 RepID=UPI0039E3B174